MSTDAFALGKKDAPVEREPHRDADIQEREPHRDADIQERELQAQERFEDELIMHLERDQFVAETSRPVPRAILSARVTVGLWALRIFVIVVSLMVLYTFVDQLH